MSPIIERLAIVGVGLIGGSFARALRAAGAVKTIVGIDTDQANLDQALSLGVVDETAPTAGEGVRNSQVVFISVPTCSISAVVREISRSLAAGCIVTDGGSVKAEIVRECQDLMPSGTFF